MAIGNQNAGYANLEPTKNYLGEALQYIGNDQFRRQQAEEEKAQRAAQAKAVQAQKEQSLRQDVAKDIDEKFKWQATENRNLNDTLTNAFVDIKNRYADAQTRYIKTGDTQALKEANNLLSNFSLMKQGADTMNGITERYMKDPAKYDPASIDNFKKNAGSMEKGNMVIGFDPSGQMRVNVFDTDEKGNPTKILVKDADAASYFQSLAPTEKFDYGAAKEKFYKDNPLDEVKYTTKDFRTVYKKQVTPEKVDQAENFAKYIISTPTALRQKWAEMHDGEYKVNFTPEEKQMIAKSVKEDIVNGYSTKNENIEDFSARTSRMAENRLNKENVIKRSIVPLNKNIVDNFNGQKYGIQFGLPKAIGFADNTVKFQNLGGANSDINSGYITAFTRDKESGRITAIGKAIVDKGQKYSLKDNGKEINFGISDIANETDPNKKAQMEYIVQNYTKPANYGTFVRNLDETEANAVAMKAGYGGYNDLQADITRQNRGYLKNQKSQPKPTQEKTTMTLAEKMRLKAKGK